MREVKGKTGQEFYQVVPWALGEGGSLRHLTEDSRPTLVALTGKFVLHFQDVVMAELPANSKVRPLGPQVALDVEEAGVEVQHSTRV